VFSWLEGPPCGCFPKGRISWGVYSIPIVIAKQAAIVATTVLAHTLSEIKAQAMVNRY
jgi:hypothetical protein